MAAYKHKRTGQWVAQISVNGKKRQLGTRATKKEALALVDAEKRRTPSTSMTIAEWRAVWLETPTWKESTRMHNRERTAPFVEEHGTKRLGQITRTVARAWLAESPSTHAALSAMFTAAMYEDNEHGAALVEGNPFSRLQKRSASRRQLAADWLTAEGIDGLETAARTVHGREHGAMVAAMIRFAAETGIRPGELFALRDEDLRDGRLLVRRAAISRTKTIGLPKNGLEREVVLPEAARLAAASVQRPEGCDLLFTTKVGKQFWSTSLSLAWDPVRNAAGRPTMDFYELRHYCATRLLEAGISDADVAVQLGHTDGGELVRRVYGHPAHRHALDRVAGALGEERAA